MAIISWESGSCLCEYDEETHILEVSGNGAMSNYSGIGNAPWYQEYGTQIQSVVIDPGVTTLGNYAFQGLTALTEIQLSSTVTALGQYCFRSCTQLTSVDLVNITQVAHYSFQGCTALTMVTIPSTVTTIYAGAFQGCSSVKSIVFKTDTWNISSIATQAFAFGSQAQPISVNVYSPNNIADGKIPDSARGSYTTVTYSDVIKRWISRDCECTLDMGTGQFEVSGNGNMDTYQTQDQVPWKDYRSDITHAVFHSGVLSIGVRCFYGCSNLRTIFVNDSVTLVGSYAFASCSSLITAKLPNATTTIGELAFGDCTALEGVIFGDGLTSIGSGAFLRCSSLRAVTIPDSVTTMDNTAFGGCTALISVTLGNGLKSINANVFNNCTALTSISIPEGVTVVASSAFSGCRSLLNVSLPTTILSLGQSVFYQCSSLVSIIIPYNLINIGSNCFSECTSLNAITFATEEWNISIGASQFALGTSETPVTAVVNSPNNLADGRLDAYKNEYTTFRYGQSETYTVTIAVNEPTYGSVTQQTLTAYVGAPVVISDNSITIGTVKIDAIPQQPTQQYTYLFSRWANAPQSILQNVTITAVFEYELNEFEVTIVSNNPEYGSVSVSSVRVPYGASITTYSQDITKITVGTTDVVATRSPWTEHYKYFFDEWSGIPTPKVVTQDITITANFHREVVVYTVLFDVSPFGFGTVSPDNLTNVEYGSSISIDGNTLTIGDKPQVVATPLSPTSQYRYLFDSWSGIPDSGTIVGNVTITAVFKRVQNQYQVSIVPNNPDYGSVDVPSVTADYGQAISATDNALTIGSTDVTATPTPSTEYYEYAFDSWSGIPYPQIVEQDITITAVFTVESGTIPIPQPTQLTYNGTVQTGVPTGAGYSITGNTGTEQGDYQAVAVLNPDSPPWSDGTRTDKIIPWVIDKLETVLTWTDVELDYNGRLQSPSCSVSNLIEGDICIVSISGAQKDAGEHIATATSLSNPNYRLPSEDFIIYRIYPRTAVLSWGSTDLEYNGNPQAPRCSVANLEQGDVCVVDVTGQGVVQGNYTARAVQLLNPNYVLPTEGLTCDFKIYAVITIASNNISYGTVDMKKVIIFEATPISASENKLHIGDTVVTATPRESTEEEFSFRNWLGVPSGGTVDVSLHITAVFVSSEVKNITTYMFVGGLSSNQYQTYSVEVSVDTYVAGGISIPMSRFTPITLVGAETVDGNVDYTPQFDFASQKLKLYRGDEEAGEGQISSRRIHLTFFGFLNAGDD